ncbi:MAG: hypothetical protein ACFCUU_02135 [Cyclobacteriaceae bacterium]
MLKQPVIGRKLSYIFFGIVLNAFFAVTVFSQERNPPAPTTNTKPNLKPHPKNKLPKQKKVRYIIKNDTKKTLLGNRCFENATQKMGFQYLVIPRGQAGNKNEWERNMNNLGVKTVVLFKNGPFWKIKERKKYKACRQTTGDIIG